MLGLPFWQLAAGILAAAFAGLALFAFVRTKGAMVGVTIGLLVAVPLAGFAAYAIVPGRVPDADSMQMAWVPALIALAGAFVVLRAAASRRGALTRSTLTLLTAGTITLWEGLVLAVSIVLAQWQPVYAVANLVLNGVWLLVWLPPGWRRLRGDASVEIGAPRARVYEFLSEPSNWPRYDADLVSVTIAPAGALQVGTRIVQVLRYEAPVRGPRILPSTVETSSVVTAVVPGERISTRLATGASAADVILSDTPAGTRLESRAVLAVPYRAAVLGGAVVLRAQRAARAARAQRNLARLKEILEQA